VVAVAVYEERDCSTRIDASTTTVGISSSSNSINSSSSSSSNSTAAAAVAAKSGGRSGGLVFEAYDPTTGAVVERLRMSGDRAVTMGLTVTTMTSTSTRTRTTGARGSVGKAEAGVLLKEVLLRLAVRRYDNRYTP
jgi:hypothetical protein